jgi:uncharacterized protein (DUF58 family)
MDDRHKLFHRVSRIEIRTRKLVEQLVGGDYRSVFRGRGVEFSEFREYMEGDDPRLIDWNVTARTGYPHVKLLTEERELSALLMVDLSGSLRFGSVRLTKLERVAEVAAVLALSAVRSNDRVGLLSFADDVMEYIPPDKGRAHALRTVGTILQSEGRAVPADVDCALRLAGRTLRRRSMLFLISDFRFSRQGSDLLGAMSRRHDVVAIHVFDPREVHVPPVGLMSMRDPESGRTRTVNTSSRAWREEFGRRVLADRRAREELCRKYHLDLVSISTADDLILPLRRFFMLRKRRRRH